MAGQVQNFKTPFTDFDNITLINQSGRRRKLHTICIQVIVAVWKGTQQRVGYSIGRRAGVSTKGDKR